jgi:hypothetical protein
MRSQAERDEQTLQIASIVFGGAVVVVAVMVTIATLAVAIDLGGAALFLVALVGYVALVAWRLSRMSPWSASSSRASARPSTPRPSSRRPRP